MITYVKGNLFDKPVRPLGVCHIVPHVANDMCVMGSGFAGELVKRYPVVKSQNTCRELGRIEIIPINTFGNVINMIAQHQTLRQNDKPIRYWALVTCMAAVAQKAEEWGSAEIHCPKFGSGLAHGKWELIEELIGEIWAKFPVYIYDIG